MIRPNSSNIAVLKISQKRTLPAQIAIGIMYTLDVLMISFLFYQLLVGILNYNIEKRKPKVSFGSLIEKGYIKIGEDLYSKNNEIL